MKYSLVLLFLIFIFSCSSEATSVEPQPEEQIAMTGKEVYKIYCVACHGVDGTLAFSGATNLKESTLAYEERLDQITNGKGAMNAFSGIIETAQIESVAKYIETLRK